MVDSFVLIPNILFNSLVNSATNCGPLSNTTLPGNPCNFYTLSRNNLANPSTDVPSVVATKCVIFDSQSHTINIASFPATTGNLVIKSTVRYAQGFLAPCLISTFLLVPLSYSSFSDINHILPHTFPPLLSPQATNNSSSPVPLSSIFHHVYLPVHHSVTGLLPLSTPHLSAHILSLPLALSLLQFATRSLITLLLLPFSSLLLL